MPTFFPGTLESEKVRQLEERIYEMERQVKELAELNYNLSVALDRIKNAERRRRAPWTRIFG